MPLVEIKDFNASATAAVSNITDVIQLFDHDKSSSISQLIKGKQRNLQKLLKYLNGTTTFASNVLLLCVSYYFCLILKIFTSCCLIVICQLIIYLTHFISTVILQNSELGIQKIE